MHNDHLSARASRRFARFLRPVALIGLSGAFLFSTACAKLESRDQMNKGVQAYKGQQYAAAVQHFQRAVNLDSKSQNARLYLATAYMVQWVPGADTPENNRNYDMAQRTFKEVLQDDPTNSLALNSLAFMAYNRASAGTPEQKQAALENARSWNKRRIQADPNDSQAYYYLGVIDYDEAYPPINTASVDEKLTDQDHVPIKDKIVRQMLVDRFLPRINRAIDNLKKCLSIDPENDNAMEYINLLLRSKARLEDTTEQAQADFAQADSWASKSMAMHKKKAEEARAKAAKSSS